MSALRVLDDAYAYTRSTVQDTHATEVRTERLFAKLAVALRAYAQRQAPFAARGRREIRVEMYLKEALDRLPRDERAVLVLRHVAGLSPREIAELLGKTEASIHGVHHHARVALQAAARDLGAGPITTTATNGASAVQSGHASDGANALSLVAAGVETLGDGDLATTGSPEPSRIEVSVVVPAMNEEHNIGWVLERIPDFVDEVILVDGNSSDNTVAVSRALRPDIRVVTQDRPGKGAALRAGFAAARGEVIVMIDADRSMDPSEMDRFVEPIRAGHDLVKGSRFITGGGTDDMERVRRFGNGVLNGLVNVLYRVDFTDLCYGYVAFRRQRLDDLALTADGFEIETEIVCRALKAGFNVAEVPSFEAPREYGESNLRTWRDGQRVLRTLVRHRFTPGQREGSSPVTVEPLA
jgi:hypothetical protein